MSAPRTLRAAALAALIITAGLAAPGSATAGEKVAKTPANGALLIARAGNLYSILPTGAGLKKLTATGSVQGAQWSPDGTRIAFSDLRSGNYDIYVMKANGSGVTRVTTSIANERNPTWSPDGRQLAFDSDRTGLTDVYRLRSTVPYGAAVKLTASYYDSENDVDHAFAKPRWSPATNTILITGEINWHDGNFSRPPKLIDATTGALKPNTWPGLDALSYDWNPSGTRFAASWDLSGGWEIDYNCLVTVLLTKATPAPLNNCRAPRIPTWTAVWSPDGLLIAYAQDGSWDTSHPGSTYLMTATGANKRLFLANAMPLDWKKQ